VLEDLSKDELATLLTLIERLTAIAGERLDAGKGVALITRKHPEMLEVL